MSTLFKVCFKFFFEKNTIPSGNKVTKKSDKKNHGELFLNLFLTCISAQIGMQPVFDQFCREFVSPIIEMLYPEYIALGDTCDNYPFTVDYRKDPSKDFDVDMKHHRDSSLATLNVCLGYKFTAGNLQFWGDDPDSLPYDDSKGEGEMKMTPGLSLLHKGGHMHAALPITSGHRVNLIMWMYGEGGYVRSGKCPPTLQTTALGRWSER